MAGKKMKNEKYLIRISHSLILLRQNIDHHYTLHVKKMIIDFIDSAHCKSAWFLYLDWYDLYELLLRISNEWLFLTPCPSAWARCALVVASSVNKFARIASLLPNYVSPANRFSSTGIETLSPMILGEFDRSRQNRVLSAWT